MEDDGTVSYSRSSGSSGSSANDGLKTAIQGEDETNAFSSDSEVVPNQQQQQFQFTNNKNSGQSLSKLIQAPETTPDLQKDASTSTGIHGADLKALLPTTKMRFMKLDKFGRRVQRMEDDGTVSYSRSSSSGSSGSSSANDEKKTAIQGEDEATSPIGNLESESTIDLGTRQTSDSYVNQSGTSVNLKDLAGISKRPVFTKLDFKGGSVEDDRRMTSSSSSSVPPQMVEGGGQAASSSGLKGLALSSKRPIFTKLDFKGGSVVDERRAKKKAPSTTNTAEASSSSSSSTTKSNLKDLLPTRPTFTKLDFKGGNVEDERRTKKQPDQDHSKLSSSGSLQSLLPERKFMWKKQERRSNTNDFIGSVGGDFIARTTTASKNDSVREAKQKAMRNEVIASATVATGALDEDEEDESGGVQEVESYSNLTDLLPQKKFVFRDTK